MISEMFQKFKNVKEGSTQGVALLYVILVIGFLVAISSSAIAIAYQQTILSSYNINALSSYYASESGLECGLYWDVERNIFRPDPSHPDGANYQQVVRCNGELSLIRPNTGVSDVNFSYSDGSVAEVRVDKRDFLEPTIKSFGYNTDDVNSGSRLQRGVNLTYSQDIDPQLPKNDVVLILDTSVSVSESTYILLPDGSSKTEFQLLKDWANVVVDKLVDEDGLSIIDPDGVRVAISEFAYNSRLLLPFSTDTTVIKNNINTQLKSAPWSDIATNLDGGLYYARTELNNNVRSGDPTEFKLAIVITDGQTNQCTNNSGVRVTCGSPTSGPTGAKGQAHETADLLKSDGTLVAVIGVGIGGSTTYDGQTMSYRTYLTDYIASTSTLPDASGNLVENTPLYFSATDFSLLESAIEELMTAVSYLSSQSGFKRQEL